jgi:hypothetical protein
MTIRNSRFRADDSEFQPEVPKDLIDYLREIIPDKHPSINTPDREIWFNAGKRSVVDMLAAWYKRQNDQIEEI